MLGESVNGLSRVQIPDEEFVVVSAGGQILRVRRPFQPANFLSVAGLKGGIGFSFETIMSGFFRG